MTHAELLAKANVTFVGYGNKNGSKARSALVCGVTRKLPESALAKKDRIPKRVGSRPTDVVETGVIRALRTGRHRPAPGGVSIGHHAITAGTLGCIVRDSQGRRLILSNNHVLANSNDAEIGDSIYQPGPHDGGDSGDLVARLEDFVEIDFGDAPTDCPIGDFFARMANVAARMFRSSTRLRAIRTEAEENLVDAAIALPVGADLVLDTVIDLGKPDAVKDAALGDQVTKSGRTTGTTEDEITAVSATVDVNYGAGKTARFRNQLIAGPMSKGGDSGSVVFLKGTQTLVGLLFAGSEQTTVMNQMSDVVRLLGLTL